MPICDSTCINFILYWGKTVSINIYDINIYDISEFISEFILIDFYLKKTYCICYRLYFDIINQVIRNYLRYSMFSAILLKIKKHLLLKYIIII